MAASITFQRTQQIYGTPPPADQGKVDPANFSNIKCFDLPEIEAAGFDRFDKINVFCKALKADGFVAVKMSPEMEAVVKESDKVLELYFEQPLGVKERDHHQDLGSGYLPKGETGDKEKFLFSPGFKNYPKGDPDFERAIEAYRTSLSRLSAQIFEYISVFLKEPLEDKAIVESGANHTLHAIHYPPLSNTAPHESVRFASKGDPSAITLMPSGSASGLQLQQKNGAWKPIMALEGYMIVGSGRQLWRKTASEFPETIYRVVNPEGETTKEKRLDMVFFVSWSPDFDLTPLGSCNKRVTADMTEKQKADHFKQFPRVNVKQSGDARLIELGIVTDPSKEEIEELVKLGLVLEPPTAIATKYPALFPNFINWGALDLEEF